MKYITILFSIALLLGCTPKEQKSTAITFGGEIRNPKANFVVLHKNDKVIDTLNLNEKNRFLKTYSTLKEGLYTFTHGVEFQYIYFTPKDSVLIRLNTWDFDKSLVFNGKGSAKNEFLLKMLLLNEEDKKNIYNQFHLNENVFSKKLDSLKEKKLALFKEFEKTETELTNKFKNLINVAINFSNYKLKEIYPYYHKKKLKLEKLPMVSNSFYAFRKKIDLNEESLLSFYPYQNYIISYLHNISAYQKETNPTQKDPVLNLLNNINEKITITKFKNSLLKIITTNNLLLENKVSEKAEQKRIHTFLKICTNKEYKEQVKNLIKDIKTLKVGEKFKNLKITSTKGKSTSLYKEIGNKSSVIYFWNEQYMSPEHLVKRINSLQKSFPNITFIGIHIDDNCEMENNPYLKKFNPKLLFRVENYKSLSFLNTTYPRAIILKKDKTIISGYTQIYHNKIKSILKNLD